MLHNWSVKRAVACRSVSRRADQPSKPERSGRPTPPDAPEPAEPPDPPEPPDQRAVEITNPRSIRALAHPARLAVIEALYAGGEMTATECAEIVGLSPSAMSYHLRSLERAGIVERAPSSGDNRERPWRAAGTYLRIEPGSGAGALAASAALSETVLGRTVSEFNAWMDRRAREPQAWRESGGSSSGLLWLTPEEAEEVQQRMFETWEPYRGRRTATRPEGARRVRIALLVFPVDEPS